MTTLSHNTRDLTSWLRDEYPEVLEEYESKKDTEWKEKVSAPFVDKASLPKSMIKEAQVMQNFITRVSYLKPNGQPFKIEHPEPPKPEIIQKLPTEDDYRNLIYLAEEMDLDRAVIQNMNEIKRETL